MSSKNHIRYSQYIFSIFITGICSFYIGLNVSPIANQDLQIEVRFSPQENCLEKIIHEISKAKKEILIQAYSFTSQDIINALIRQNKKNVNIIIIADHSQINNLNLYKLKNEPNIEVFIDKLPGIAHNKVMIIDNKTVLTGSFNFSHAAQYRNAENSLVIISKKLAALYAKNFWYRYLNSKSL